MVDVDASYDALSSFSAYWRRQGATGFDDGEQPSFDALVQTNSVSAQFSGSVHVLIINSGFNDGRVILNDRHSVLPKSHHTEFSAAFQTMAFDTDTHALIISGKSAKMGDHRIVILPASVSRSN